MNRQSKNILSKIKKVFTSRIYLKTSNYILLVSFYIAVIYNFFALPIKTQANSGLSVSYIVAEFCLIYILVTVFFCLFSFSKMLLKFWVIFFILISTIISYYMMSYHIFIEELLVGTILESSTDEVAAVLSLNLALFFIIFALIPLYIFLLTIKIKPLQLISNLKNLTILFSSLKIAFILLILYGLSYIINPALMQGRYVLKNSLSFYTPINYIAATYLYAYKFSYKKNDVATIDIAKQYNFTFKPSKMKNSKLNIILIIGESARADHQALNGYQRDTNPELAKINNLVSFSKVYACATMSRASVTCLLSRKTRYNLELPLKESNLISVFNALGFNTYFFSSQVMYDANYNYFYLASKDAQHIAFINNLRKNISSKDEIYDAILLKETAQIVKKTFEKKKLIVLYLVGSHLPYDKRYPKAFQKFKPDNASKNVKSKALINAYDNSILYSDYIISQVIEQYKEQNTFIYYISDHGESLGEDGLFYHGAKYEIAPEEQKHVAQFVWASDSMIKLLGNKYNNIKANKDKTISQDFVFHSLLNCLGVESKIVDKRLSICN